MSNPFMLESKVRTETDRLADMILTSSEGRAENAARSWLVGGLKLARMGPSGLLIFSSCLCHMTHEARTHPQGEEFLEGLAKALQDLQKLEFAERLGRSLQAVQKERA